MKKSDYEAKCLDFISANISIRRVAIVFIAALLIGIQSFGVIAADSTAFDYGEVEQDVSDISFYQGPSDSGTIAQTQELVASEVRNVILLIGDGMAPAQIQLARLKAVGADGKLFMERLPVIGLMRTHSLHPIVTDSAAAGTALASGVKTQNGMLGLDGKGQPFQTLLEVAQKKGKRTGLVATAKISHATPAAFASHVKDRDNEEEIAEQILANKVNVLFGGGKKYWRESERRDGRDLLGAAREMGYGTAFNLSEMQSAEGEFVLGLFSEGHPTSFRPEPMLAEMTAKALELLEGGKNGFFVMIEGSQIDWACHANNSDNTIRQTLLFDQAVQEAIVFARADGRTLVLVTSDHECGGLTVFGAGGEDERIESRWSTEGHSAMDVPVYSYGPGSDSFSGVFDNTDLAKRIAALMGAKDFPKPLQ